MHEKITIINNITVTYKIKGDDNAWRGIIRCNNNIWHKMKSNENVWSEMKRALHENLLKKKKRQWCQGWSGIKAQYA